MTRQDLGARWSRLPHPLRWIGVATVGGGLVLAGLVLMVLPGPGIPLLIVGLVILATEFAWAETLLQRVKQQGTALTSTVSARLARAWTTMRRTRRLPRSHAAPEHSARKHVDSERNPR